MIFQIHLLPLKWARLNNMNKDIPENLQLSSRAGQLIYSPHICLIWIVKIHYESIFAFLPLPKVCPLVQIKKKGWCTDWWTEKERKRCPRGSVNDLTFALGWPTQSTAGCNLGSHQNHWQCNCKNGRRKNRSCRFFGTIGFKGLWSKVCVPKLVHMRPVLLLGVQGKKHQHLSTAAAAATALKF